MVLDGETEVEFNKTLDDETKEVVGALLNIDSDVSVLRLDDGLDVRLKLEDKVLADDVRLAEVETGFPADVLKLVTVPNDVLGTENVAGRIAE